MYRILSNNISRPVVATYISTIEEAREIVAQERAASPNRQVWIEDYDGVEVKQASAPTYEVREQTSTTDPADRGTLIRVVLTFTEARETSRAAWAAGRVAYISKVEAR